MPEAARWLARLTASLLLGATAHAAAVPAVVIVLGDSIAAGNALPEVERDRAWVTRVEQMSQGRLQMINEGKPGRATGALDEFGELLARHQRADVVAIALGTNDSRDLAPAQVRTATDNLRQMITLARVLLPKLLQVAGSVP